LVENNFGFCIRGGIGSLVGGREEGLNREILEDLISESEDLILESEDLILKDSILFVLI
jgi:hypothetical protein